ncbi:MAG: gliding motility protein GldL, partial [Bacteroidales bacterium]|nr:gliding motility protein GldL [Bacteroidales bacterium]
MSSNNKGLASPLGKKIMGYAYGIGASIVIMGALFKILHLPGSSVMLSLGMGTEALLFFLGSFEPPHQEATHWDWTKVYPDLIPVKSPEEMMLIKKSERKLEKGKTLNKKDAKKAEALQPIQEKGEVKAPKVSPMSAMSGEDTEQWNKNIKNILSTVDGLSKLSDTGKISESYVSKLSNAGEAVEHLSKAQEASAEIILSSTENLAENYKVSSEKFDLTMTTA